MRITARRLIVITVASIAGLGILAVVALLTFLQTGRGRDYVRGLAERQASRALGAQVTMKALEGSLLYGATIRELAIRDGSRDIAAVGAASATYDLFDMLRGTFALDEIVLERPVVYAGALSLLGREDAQDPPPARQAFSIASLIVRDGRIVVGAEPAEVGGFEIPDEIRDLDADLSLEIGPATTRVAVNRLSFVGDAPSVTLRQLSGTIAIDGDDLVLEALDVRLAESSMKLSGTIANFRNLGGTGGVSNATDDNGPAAALAHRP